MILTLRQFAFTATCVAAASLAHAEPRWVPSGGNLPPNAFAGGSENGRPLHVCRARVAGGVHAGKVVMGRCNIGHGGREKAERNFEVLVDVTGESWVPARTGEVPPYAFPGGSQGDATFYVCRSERNGALHPGRTIGGACSVGFGGRELLSPTYEILVVPPPPPVRVVQPVAPTPAAAPNWVRGKHGKIPPDAVAGGEEYGRPLVLCRVAQPAGTFPGKIVGRACNFGTRGQELSATEYEVLVGAELRWTVPQAANLPAGALAGGDEGGRPTYVCRGSYSGGTHPGRVVDGRCNITYAGRELVLPIYEVAVYVPPAPVQPQPIPAVQPVQPVNVVQPVMPVQPVQPTPPAAGGVKWVKVPRGSIPEGAVLAGEEAGRPVYVCRASHQGNVSPGKVVGPNCNIPSAGYEVQVADYEVLTFGR